MEVNEKPGLFLRGRPDTQIHTMEYMYINMKLNMQLLAEMSQ